MLPGIEMTQRSRQKKPGNLSLDIILANRTFEGAYPQVFFNYAYFKMQKVSKESHPLSSRSIGIGEGLGVRCANRLTIND